MEELSGRGSRRPLRGVDEREGKTAAIGVQQQREWLGKPCLLTSEQRGQKGGLREKTQKKKEEERKRNGRKEG